MHADADIARGIWRAALLRRLPLWVLGALPWLSLRLLPGLLAWIAWCMWDGARLRQRVSRGWTSWLDADVPELEDSSALLVDADTPLARMQRERLLARIAERLDARTVRAIVRRHVDMGLSWLAPWLVFAAIVWYFGQQGSAAQPADRPIAPDPVRRHPTVREAWNDRPSD